MSSPNRICAAPLRGDKRANHDSYHFRGGGEAPIPSDIDDDSVQDRANLSGDTQQLSGSGASAGRNLRFYRQLAEPILVHPTCRIPSLSVRIPSG